MGPWWRVSSGSIATPRRKWRLTACLLLLALFLLAVSMVKGDPDAQVIKEARATVFLGGPLTSSRELHREPMALAALRVPILFHNKTQLYQVWLHNTLFTPYQLLAFLDCLHSVVCLPAKCASSCSLRLACIQCQDNVFAKASGTLQPHTAKPTFLCNSVQCPGCYVRNLHAGQTSSGGR